MPKVRIISKRQLKNLYRFDRKMTAKFSIVDFTQIPYPPRFSIFFDAILGNGSDT